MRHRVHELYPVPRDAEPDGVSDAEPDLVPDVGLDTRIPSGPV
jgi:hypothetical protein